MAKEFIENDPQVYSDTWAYLSEELERLDLLIASEVSQQRSQPTVLSEQLKGLVLPDEEIALLISGSGKKNGDRSGPAPRDTQDQNEPLVALDSRIQQRRAATLKEKVYLALPHLAALFQLTRFEEQCLIICLASEIDRKYDKLYAFLHDDVTRKQPSLDVVLRLLCRTSREKLAARAAFAVDAPLLKFRLVQMRTKASDGLMPLRACPLKLDDRIVDFLLGFGQLDSRLASFGHLEPPNCGLQTSEVETAMRAFVRQRVVNQDAKQPAVAFHLYGRYGTGKRNLAAAASQELGTNLLVCNAERLVRGDLPPDEAVWLLAREAFLQPAVLCIENCDTLIGADANGSGHAAALLEALALFRGLTFLVGTKPWSPRRLHEGLRFVDLEVPTFDTRCRAEYWQSLIDNVPVTGCVDTRSLASRFRFTAGQVRDAFGAAQALAQWRSPEREELTEEDICNACRTLTNPTLVTLARRITPRYDWGDIILPDDQRLQLQEVCGQARNRHRVLGEWGFDDKLSLGKGLSVLFSGPPGTGKTMAAEVIAKDLGLDLYKIDLSQVVSKYIGETEKSLERIFTAAEDGNTILLFDEADALFGKRSEVRDSHDRYANVEISYLLQKMEEYEGIAILATNLRQHIDEAFLRRLRFIVEFPFPDERDRERIWKVTFPRRAPLSDDVDAQTLAREIKLAGGNIKNISLTAAFYAAEDDGVILMSHVLRAAHREYLKLGRAWETSAVNHRGEPVS